MQPLRAGDAPGRASRRRAPSVPRGSPERPWSASAEQPGLALDYEAGGAFLAADGEGEIAFSVDGTPREPVLIGHPGLHAVTVHERHEAHRIELRPSAGIELYSVFLPRRLPKRIIPTSALGLGYPNPPGG